VVVMLTKVRRETAEFLHGALIKIVNDHFSLATAAANAGNSQPEVTALLSSDKLEASLEVPKKLEFGHLAFPIFPLAKILKKAPPVIAKEVSEALVKIDHPLIKKAIALIAPAGGFINITFKDDYLQEILLASVMSNPNSVGHSSIGKGKTLVIDYSSPNVAKPMHVGHLRATIIGQAIRNLAATQGYHVIGLNHLGDWGVQFGKLAWAFEKWGAEYDFKNKPFESLYSMYVRFHDEAEKNPAMDAEGSLMFKRLEDGDAKVTAVWKEFVEISLQEYGKMYSLLGVSFDLIRGESFYNDRLKSVEKLLEDKGLLVESDGAMVVPLGDEMPPCLIRKSDGASLYATRDIASAIHRHDDLKSDMNLYVVGVDQTLHFKQVFKVLELMGYPWAKDCHHLAFGMYRFKEGKMSTRKGRTIFLEDVVLEAIEQVGRLIAAKNPNLENRAKVAEQVGIGAIIFNDLAVDRVRDVEFDWAKALNFEGDSGPYVQYMHVRCLSLIRKYAKPIPQAFTAVLSTTEERDLIRLLLGYQDVLTGAFTTFRPNILAQYLLELCGSFSRFYYKNRILGEAPEVESSRMLLVELSRRVLAAGLQTMNMQAPEAM
jgi:arginyl-tRNA synthetase